MPVCPLRFRVARFLVAFLRCGVDLPPFESLHRDNTEPTRQLIRQISKWLTSSNGKAVSTPTDCHNTWENFRISDCREKHLGSVIIRRHLCHTKHQLQNYIVEVFSYPSTTHSAVLDVHLPQFTSQSHPSSFSTKHSNRRPHEATTFVQIRTEVSPLPLPKKHDVQRGRR